MDQGKLDELFLLEEEQIRKISHLLRLEKNTILGEPSGSKEDLFLRKGSLFRNRARKQRHLLKKRRHQRKIDDACGRVGELIKRTQRNIMENVKLMRAFEGRTLERSQIRTGCDDTFYLVRHDSMHWDEIRNQEKELEEQEFDNPGLTIEEIESSKNIMGKQWIAEWYYYESIIVPRAITRELRCQGLEEAIAEMNFESLTPTTILQIQRRGSIVKTFSYINSSRRWRDSVVLEKAKINLIRNEGIRNGVYISPVSEFQYLNWEINLQIDERRIQRMKEAIEDYLSLFHR